MTLGPLERAACREALWDLDSRAAIDAAVAGLEAGHDSPALRILAGLQSHEEADAHDWWRRARRELGIALPDERAAAMALGREVAQGMVSGEIPPSEGAWRIWVLSEHLWPAPHELDRLILAADLWECEPENRASFRDDILAVAQALLDEAPGSDRDP